jgi:NADH dehydrogenase
VLWFAGIKAPAFLRNPDGLETNRLNQLVVNPTLHTIRESHTSTIANCAACPWQKHATPVTPRAQATRQQASRLHRQMPRHIAGKPLQPYTYLDFGSLASLGEYITVGNLTGFLVGKSSLIPGYFAHLMYRSLYMMHQIALYGRWKALLGTLPRSFSRRSRSLVKLHWDRAANLLERAAIGVITNQSVSACLFRVAPSDHLIRIQ